MVLIPLKSGLVGLLERKTEVGTVLVTVLIPLKSGLVGL